MMFGTIKLVGVDLRRKYLPYEKFCEVAKNPKDFEYLTHNVTFELNSRYSIAPVDLIEWFEDWIKRNGESIESFWTSHTEILPSGNSYVASYDGKITILFESENDLKKIETILVKNKLAGDDND